MKSLVCVSNTPDTTAKISFTEDNKAFNKDGVNYIMNPYDEWYALVKAIEIKEQHGGEVTILHVGEASSDIIIRKALAIGGDKAVRINKAPSSSWDVAQQIAAHVKSNDYNLVFLGKETIDHNGAEVGALVAELLDWSYVSLASDMKAEGDHAIVTRDIEGGTETLKVGYPLVISAAKGLAEQRIPNMRGIMMAKRKPLEVAEPVDVQDSIELAHFALPPAKEGVKMVDADNMDELVRLLHEEAKVI